MHKPWLCMWRETFLAIGLKVGNVGIIDLSTNGHELTNMLCHCQKIFLMLLATLKCLALWIYNMNIINCHFMKVTRQILHFGALTKMGWILCIIGNFCLLGWKMHSSRISKGDGSSSCKLGSCQMLHWWHYCAWFRHGRTWSSFAKCV